MSQLVHLRIPDQLYEDTKLLAQANYSSTQDFIRDAIRKSVQEAKKAHIIEQLYKLKGSKKGEPRTISQEEYEELFKKLITAQDNEQ